MSVSVSTKALKNHEQYSIMVLYCFLLAFVNKCFCHGCLHMLMIMVS